MCVSLPYLAMKSILYIWEKKVENKKRKKKKGEAKQENELLANRVS